MNFEINFNLIFVYRCIVYKKIYIFPQKKMSNNLLKKPSKNDIECEISQKKFLDPEQKLPYTPQCARRTVEEVVTILKLEDKYPEIWKIIEKMLTEPKSLNREEKEILNNMVSTSIDCRNDKFYYIVSHIRNNYSKNLAPLGKEDNEISHKYFEKHLERLLLECGIYSHWKNCIGQYKLINNKPVSMIEIHSLFYNKLRESSRYLLTDPVWNVIRAKKWDEKFEISELKAIMTLPNGMLAQNIEICDIFWNNRSVCINENLEVIEANQWDEKFELVATDDDTVVTLDGKKVQQAHILKNKLVLIDENMQILDDDKRDEYFKVY